MIAKILTFFRQLARVLLPLRKFKKAPRRLISPYAMQGATEAERILMLAHVARSPLDARILLNKYHTDDPHEVLARLPRKKPKGFKHRLKKLIRRFEGHDTTNPYEIHKDDKHKIQVRYRLKTHDKK